MAVGAGPQRVVPTRGTLGRRRCLAIGKPKAQTELSIRYAEKVGESRAPGGTTARGPANEDTILYLVGKENMGHKRRKHFIPKGFLTKEFLDKGVLLRYTVRAVL